ncbi:MAG: formamidopyrimidine-DNA glycosylase [Clostridiales bacterium GWF2_38_85]|nr:MAG: formamidopyrimidine-DNA glycosylase [Clostridiales bacterium GWF2_38_85]HBL84356.1 endonuclease VIII [Clostridiales bacterium]
MIEFPESRHLAEQIKEHLLGKTVMNVEANKSPHKFAWFHGDPAGYHNKLTGKSITGTNAYGGMTEIVFNASVGEMRLVLNDGVNIRYFASGEILPPKHQLCVEFDDFSSLVCSVQMYGGLFLMDTTGEENGYYLSSKTKISLLSEENNEDYFFGLMNEVKQNYSIKAFLATEQRFPGLGNGVLQDILWDAKVHPRRKLETLTQQEKQAVYKSVKQTLFEMTTSGGRDTEKDIFGCPGGYKTKLSAKTKDSPCPVCGDAIIREAFLGGNVYFCPTCQRYEKGGK